MDTAFIVVIVSLFIITPLSMVFAIANDNDVVKVAAIILTVVIHVAFRRVV